MIYTLFKKVDPLKVSYRDTSNVDGRCRMEIYRSVSYDVRQGYGSPTVVCSRLVALRIQRRISYYFDGWHYVAVRYHWYGGDHFKSDVCDESLLRGYMFKDTIKFEFTFSEVMWCDTFPLL